MEGDVCTIDPAHPLAMDAQQSSSHAQFPS
jgi:hypothetical protein